MISALVTDNAYKKVFSLNIDGGEIKHMRAHSHYKEEPSGNARKKPPGDSREQNEARAFLRSHPPFRPSPMEIVSIRAR